MPSKLGEMVYCHGKYCGVFNVGCTHNHVGDLSLYVALQSFKWEIWSLRIFKVGLGSKT